MGDEQLFDHLANEEFTAHEAAEYLEISMSTFRRYVHDGKVKPSGESGLNQLFSASHLKTFKCSKDMKQAS